MPYGYQTDSRWHRGAMAVTAALALITLAPAGKRRTGRGKSVVVRASVHFHQMQDAR